MDAGTERGQGGTGGGPIPLPSPSPFGSKGSPQGRDKLGMLGMGTPGVQRQIRGLHVPVPRDWGSSDKALPPPRTWSPHTLPMTPLGPPRQHLGPLTPFPSRAAFLSLSSDTFGSPLSHPHPWPHFCPFPVTHLGPLQGPISGPSSNPSRTTFLSHHVPPQGHISVPLSDTFGSLLSHPSKVTFLSPPPGPHFCVPLPSRSP